MEMDFIPTKDESSQADSNQNRLKTSLRLKYEAEARVLRKEMGTLDSVRERLSISRRKMCQILLIDPSAWTRWMKDESKIPPHIYKALQWYLIVIDKYPVFDPHHNMSVANPVKTHLNEDFKIQRDQFETELKHLKKSVQRGKIAFALYTVLLILCFALKFKS